MMAILWFRLKGALIPTFYKIESEDQTADGPTRPNEVGC